jgi:hypothetical protein
MVGYAKPNPKPISQPNGVRGYAARYITMLWDIWYSTGDFRSHVMQVLIFMQKNLYANVLIFMQRIFMQVCLFSCRKLFVRICGTEEARVDL